MKYSTTISFSKGEIISIRDAIKVYREFVKKEIGDEIKAPYWGRLQSINSLEEKINNESAKAFQEFSERMEKVMAKYK